VLLLRSFGIQFETPELVVVGMQSDGKSSFIEALLGFQFNIVETSTHASPPRQWRA
jgi:GTPase SAR1 family protein